MRFLKKVDMLPYAREAIATAGLVILGGVLDAGAGAAIVPAVVILVLAVAMTTWSPAAGLAAVLLAAPTMFQLNPMPRGSFSLLELAILVAAAGTGLRFLSECFRSGRSAFRSLPTSQEIVVPVVGILLAAGIAFLNIADPSHRTESLREIRVVIVEPIIFLATALIVLRDRSARWWAGAMLMAGGTVVSLLAIGQAASGGGVIAGSVNRATVSYPHPNNLAFFLERTLLFSLGTLIIRPRWWPIWLIAAVQAAGLAVTFSRGALLGVGAGVALLLLLFGMRRALLMLAGGGLLGGVLAVVVARDRLLDLGGSGSEPTRFAIWRSSLRMLADHPLTGVGPDQFLYQYLGRYVEPVGWPERYTSHPHNLLLDVWLRLGIVGVAAFSSLVYGTVRLVHRGRSMLRGDAIAAGSIAALVGGAVHGLVDQSFFLPDLATMTWFFIALLSTITLAHRDQK